MNADGPEEKGLGDAAMGCLDEDDEEVKAGFANQLVGLFKPLVLGTRNPLVEDGGSAVLCMIDGDIARVRAGCL